MYCILLLANFVKKPSCKNFHLTRCDLSRKFTVQRAEWTLPLCLCMIIMLITFRELDTELKTAKSEYERINRYNEEIIELIGEMEKEMNQKLEREQVKNSILSQQIKEWEIRDEDYDRIIQKCRQKITELNEKVEEQKDEVCFFHYLFGNFCICF